MQQKFRIGGTNFPSRGGPALVAWLHGDDHCVAQTRSSSMHDARDRAQSFRPATHGGNNHDSSAVRYGFDPFTLAHCVLAESAVFSAFFGDFQTIATAPRRWTRQPIEDHRQRLRDESSNATTIRVRQSRTP